MSVTTQKGPAARTGNQPRLHAVDSQSSTASPDQTGSLSEADKARIVYPSGTKTASAAPQPALQSTSVHNLSANNNVVLWCVAIVASVVTLWCLLDIPPADRIQWSPSDSSSIVHPNRQQSPPDNTKTVVNQDSSQVSPDTRVVAKRDQVDPGWWLDGVQMGN